MTIKRRAHRAVQSLARDLVPPIERPPSRPRGDLVVRTWLFTLAALVAVMVSVGGATRLTGSGLSIPRWAPITGTVPPLSEEAWQRELDRYRDTPQYRLVNRGMTLDEFRSIYWWEWAHRFLGRLIGLAFLVPFVALVTTRRLHRRAIPWVLGAFVLGALQGGLGWYMVASGLVDRPRVSPVRLAAHLMLAAVIFAYLMGLASSIAELGRDTPRARPSGAAKRLRWTAGALVVLVIAQIGLGALVSGLHAGLVHPTWPLMSGELVPDGMLVMDPWWRDLYENLTTTQFAHRTGAYVLVACALAHAIDAVRSLGVRRARAALVLLAVVLAQAVLGIATLLWRVPIELALLHQAGAMLVLAVAVHEVVALRRLRTTPARSSTTREPGPCTIPL